MAVERLLVSTQHHPDVHDEQQIRADVIEHVLLPVIPEHLCPHERLSEPDFVLVNPTGRFVTGGPMGDTGLTGRKIIVDTYGGAARHGGGAFSGKDPSKVDRSGAYAMRWVAKNIVAAGLAARAEVQVAYAIGVAHPVSVMVETFGTEQVDRAIDRDGGRARCSTCGRRPSSATSTCCARSTGDTAAYGHFGRELPSLHLGAHRPRRRPARGLRARRARLGLIARIQPLVTARAVDRPFDYAVPAQLAADVVRGSLVRVPLGRREVDGVVESVASEPDAAGGELKPVLEVTGQVPEPCSTWPCWIAEGTASTLARALALVMPPRPPKRRLKPVAEPSPRTGR